MSPNLVLLILRRFFVCRSFCVARYMVKSSYELLRISGRVLCDFQSVSDSKFLSALFKKTLKLKRMYLDRKIEESAPNDEDYLCNYSCIDSIVNFVLEDS